MSFTSWRLVNPWCVEAGAVPCYCWSAVLSALWRGPCTSTWQARSGRAVTEVCDRGPVRAGLRNSIPRVAVGAGQRISRARRPSAPDPLDPRRALTRVA
eukprot:3737092-Prymnesium_polylepis.1